VKTRLASLRWNSTTRAVGPQSGAKRRSSFGAMSVAALKTHRRASRELTAALVRAARPVIAVAMVMPELLPKFSSVVRHAMPLTCLSTWGREFRRSAHRYRFLPTPANRSVVVADRLRRNVLLHPAGARVLNATGERSPVPGVGRYPAEGHREYSRQRCERFLILALSRRCNTHPVNYYGFLTSECLVSVEAVG
jgi:hypothetical protein